MRITCSCVRPISFLIRELFNLLSDLFFFAQIFKLFPPFLINIICNFLNFFKKTKQLRRRRGDSTWRRAGLTTHTYSFICTWPFMSGECSTTTCIYLMKAHMVCRLWYIQVQALLFLYFSVCGLHSWSQLSVTSVFVSIPARLLGVLLFAVGL